MKTTYFKVYSLLSSARRRGVLLLLGLIIVGTMFEILGIGLLLPVMMLLVEGDLEASYPAVKPVLDVLGNPDHPTQVRIIMIGLVVVYLAKNLYLAFLTWWQARFSIGLQIELAQRLFTTYLRQPYNFHLQRNSAQLIRNVTGEVGQFTNSAVRPMLILAAESLVLLCILILLVSVEPLGSLIVFAVLSSAAWLFYRSTRARITRWGEVRQFHDGQRIQHLQQGLGGVKDVKLLGRESDFLSNFGWHNAKSGQVAQFMEVLQKLPRLWLEVLAVSGLALLVLIMLAQDRQMVSIVPTIGLFAAAAFRLMPSVSRILNAVQKLRYGLSPINRLYEDFQILEPLQKAVQNSTVEKQLFGDEIRLEDLDYRYDDAPVAALSNVSMKIRRGESIGIIGPSGSGKSTLVDLILGLLTPDRGRIVVDGEDIQNDIRMWQDQIGYVPQSIYLTDDSLRRNVAFGLPEEEIDDEAVIRAIRSAQLEEFVASLPDGLETFVGERGIRLSGGQRQRIGIARALYHEPGVLVLDEATSALDTATETGVMKAVSALHGEKTIIIVAHRLSTVENCDCLYRLDQGRVIEKGTPFELLNKVHVK